MRIQILELPAIVKGDDVVTPFALIFDQCPPVYSLGQEEDQRQRLDSFVSAIGASGFFATPETVTVLGGLQDVEVATESIEEAAR